MATKEDVIKIIAKKLAEKAAVNLVGQNVKDALEGRILIQEFNTISGWIRNKDFAKVGQFVESKVMKMLTENSKEEAEIMLMDDNLALTELIRVFDL